MSEKIDKLRASLEKEKERRIKINNRIESLERRIQEAEAAEGQREWFGTAKGRRRNSLPPCCGSPQLPPRTRLRCPQSVLPLIRRTPIMKMMNKVCALVLSVALCAGMAAPAFAYDGEPVEEVEQPVLTAATEEEEAVTVTDEETVL